MKEEDVLYSDVKFTRNPEKVNEKVSSDVNTTYAEVNIKEAQASPEPSDVPQTVTAGRGSKGRVESVALVLVGLLLVAAVAALCVLVLDYMKTREMLRSGKVQWDAERANLTERLSKVNRCPTTRPPACPTTEEPCSLCEQGWERNGHTCYYFSNDRFPWNESEEECRRGGGDLVKIDSREEQDFLEKKLRKKMEEPEDKFWIGLTDSAEEGRWVWVDGSQLDSNLSYWLADGELGEPDDWKGGADKDGEDCARMGEQGGAAHLKCWFDYSCKSPLRRICEKSAQTGRVSTICVKTASV